MTRSEQIAGWRKRLKPALRKVFDAGMRQARLEGWASRVVDYQDAFAVAHGCWFSAEDADFAVDFFGLLKHSKGKWRGKPFELLEWQREIIERLFGWKDMEGWRRYQTAYIEVAKKNGKSTLAAGIELLLLVGDGEGAPEVYCAAVDTKQAAIVYNEAARMVKGSPELREVLTITRSTKTITYEDEDGVLQVLSADVESHEGLNISGAVIDELHVHKRRTLVDTLRYGGASRDQPLFVIITTAGEYDETSIGWEYHEYARQVAEGTIEDPAFLSAIFAAAKDDDIEDPKTWAKANPSLGQTLKVSEFQKAVREALNAPSKLPAFRRYRLNVWVQAAEGWVNMDAWARCRGDFDLEALAGRPCWGGLDLSSTQDTTAFALNFPPLESEEDQVHRALVWFWLPRERIEEATREHRAPYGLWFQDGWLEGTEGNVIDYRVVRARINEIGAHVEVKEICYDPYWATEIVQNLQDDGFEMLEHRGGDVSMNPPMVTMEKSILSGRIRHNGNPVLNWQMGNLVARYGATGLMKPDKSVRRRKIDGPVALIMAHGRAVVPETEEAPGLVVV